MEIIQSYSQFDNDNHYIGNKLNGTEKYLNFYTFLLSFLTLKKYYKSITMYCNRLAYDTFIKYIPYNKIVIIENKNTIEWWSAYKLDIISNMKDPFIHVDSDVFIFDDIFKPFINNDYDIIIQNSFDIDIVDKEKWINNICPIEKFNNKSFLCGVVGFKDIKIKDKYIEDTKIVKNLINENIVIGDRGFILEEFTLYLTSINNNLKYYEILPYDDIKKSIHKSGDNNKYTHMWFASKYMKSNIDLIKNKIKKEFSDYYELVEKYDNYISNFDILFY